MLIALLLNFLVLITVLTISLNKTITFIYSHIAWYPSSVNWFAKNFFLRHFTPTLFAQLIIFYSFHQTTDFLIFNHYSYLFLN